MADWEFDTEGGRYRDPSTGRSISHGQVIQLRDMVSQASEDEAMALSGMLSGGEISTGEFVGGMREVIQNSYLAQYALGRGGLDVMGPQDFGYVQEQMLGQYGFLDRFAQGVAGGEVSEAQARTRAQMYAEAGVQSYERGQAAYYGIDLPAYPGDGGTPCLSRCRCSWDIRKTTLGELSVFSPALVDGPEIQDLRGQYRAGEISFDEFVRRRRELETRAAIAAFRDSKEFRTIAEIDQELDRIDRLIKGPDLSDEEYDDLLRYVRELAIRKHMLVNPSDVWGVSAGPGVYRPAWQIREVSRNKQRKLANSRTWGEEVRIQGPYRPFLTTEIDEAREFGARLGVQYIGKAKVHVYNAVNEGLLNVRGGSLRGMRVELLSEADIEKRAGKGAIAAYQFSNKTLLINVDSSAWHWPETYAKGMFRRKIFSSNSPFHTIQHEMGHRFHAEYGDINAARDRTGKFALLTKEESSIISSRVSGYAATNGAETVAEIHAAIQAGRTFDDEVMEIFKKYGGVLLRGERVGTTGRGVAPTLGQGRFFPETTFERAERVTKSFGVRVTATAGQHGGRTASLFELNQINKALYELSQNGYANAIQGITIHFQDVVFTGLKRSFAVASPQMGSKGGILIDRSLGLLSTVGQRPGWVAADGPQALIYHEIGHLLHSRRMGKREFQRLLKTPLPVEERLLVTREVSTYAGTSPLELVAEVFSGVLSGKTYSEEVLDLYEKYRGPRLP